MVALPQCHGLTAEVFVDDRPLTEYDCNDGVTKPDTVARYVEAVEGSAFYIRLAIKAGFSTTNGMQISIWVDGNLARRVVVLVSDMESEDIRLVRGALSRIDGQSTVLPFQFSTLLTTEETVAAQEKFWEEQGQIAIDFDYITDIRESGDTGDIYRPLPADTQQAATPQNLASASSLSHFVSGGRQQRKQTTWYDYDLVGKKPFATAIFKYRSSRSLKELGIIPHMRPVALNQEPVEHARFGAPNITPSPWSPLTMYDLRAILNHHTGQQSTWDGLDRTALELLITHYSGTGSQIVNTGREHSASSTAPVTFHNDVVMGEEQPAERPSSPENEVIYRY